VEQVRVLWLLYSSDSYLMIVGVKSLKSLTLGACSSAAADIDTLCVCPRHITRPDFFTDLYELLKNEPDISELSAVPDAYVPVIKFKFANIEVR
jgi:poly(A) polymerase Pap1